MANSKTTQTFVVCSFILIYLCSIVVVVYGVIREGSFITFYTVTGLGLCLVGAILFRVYITLKKRNRQNRQQTTHRRRTRISHTHTSGIPAGTAGTSDQMSTIQAAVTVTSRMNGAICVNITRDGDVTFDMSSRSGAQTSTVFEDEDEDATTMTTLADFGGEYPNFVSHAQSRKLDSLLQIFRLALNDDQYNHSILSFLSDGRVCLKLGVQQSSSNHGKDKIRQDPPPSYDELEFIHLPAPISEPPPPFDSMRFHVIDEEVDVEC